MEKVGLFKGFVRALNDVQNRHTQPAEKRMLRAVLAIQDSIGATIGTWPQVWQKMLVEHPTFRHIMFTLNSMKNIIGTPVKLVYQLTKARGGYAAHLSKSNNPMEAAAENIGLVYADGMWRLDNIAAFTRATARATQDLSSAITGAKYPPLEGAPTGNWSLFGVARKLTNLMTKWSLPIIGGVLFGKSGWKAGKEKGDWLTEEREFFLDRFLDKLGTRKFRKSTYGAATETEFGTPMLATRFMEFLANAANNDNALPIVDITPVDAKKAKAEKKQLEYQKDTMLASEKILDLTDEINSREERRSFFSLLSGGGGIAKGLLSSVMGFIGPIFGGGITGMVQRSLQTGFLGALTHPSVLSGLATVLGPALAGALGWAVGKQLDEVLGITKTIQGNLDTLNERARLNAAETSRQMMKDSDTARNVGGAEGYKAQRKVKEMAAIGKVADRHEDMGWLGQNHLVAIDNAQRQYIAEHMDSYSNYNPDEILRLRKKWIEAGGMRGKGFGEDPHMYGLEREKAFHTYLYRNGMKMDAWEREAREQSYHEQFAKAHPIKTAKDAILAKYKEGKTYLIDKATGTYKDISKLAASEVEELLAQGAIVVNELEKQGEQALDAAKKTAGAVSQATAQSATMISTTINNASKVISTGSERAYNEVSPYAREVLKGNLFED